MNGMQNNLRISLICGIALLLLCISVGRAQTWIQQFPTGTPPSPRYSTGQAYDQAHDRLILFGGEAAAGSRPTDVWIMANATGVADTPSWIQLLPDGTSGPEGRWSATVVYDPNNNRIIVHGGCFGNCLPMAYDTWVLTNANGLDAIAPQWIHIADLPVGVAEHCAAYDSVNNRMMIFGGELGFYGTDQNEVWVLHDANGIGSPAWELLAPAGTRPLRRTGCSAVYDQSSNRMVVFGGTHVEATWSVPYNDVWALTNANGLGGTPEWLQLSPAAPLPSARYYHSAMFDSATKRMMVFGGTFYERQIDPVGTYLNDSWLLTSASGGAGTPEWVQLSPASPLPPTRQGFSAAYSPSSNRMVVAMGRFINPGVSQVLLNDAWVLLNANGIPRYKFSGFFPPVNTEAWNAVNAGRSVPLKWQLRSADDSLIRDLAVVAGLSSAPLTCPTGSASSVDPASTADSPGLKYDSPSEQYVFVWKTNKSWAGTCRRFTLKLDDGSAYATDFDFR